MCFSSGSGVQSVSTSDLAAAPASPLPNATPAALGLARKNENMANFGDASGPDTQIERSSPAVSPRTSTTTGNNTNFNM